MAIIPEVTDRPAFFFRPPAERGLSSSRLTIGFEAFGLKRALLEQPFVSLPVILAHFGVTFRALMPFTDCRALGFFAVYVSSVLSFCSPIAGRKWCPVTTYSFTFHLILWLLFLSAVLLSSILRSGSQYVTNFLAVLATQRFFTGYVLWLPPSCCPPPLDAPTYLRDTAQRPRCQPLSGTDPGLVLPKISVGPPPPLWLFDPFRVKLVQLWPRIQVCPPRGRGRSIFFPFTRVFWCFFLPVTESQNRY